MSVHQANSAQKIAANPENSCWVEASAGSGKTKVLTDRVLNLLLHGADPEKILCLTFTKAAAAEMGNRLRHRLSTWANIKDKDLYDDLEKLVPKCPEKYIHEARHLFGKFIDTPGGLKIQTIHSFCHALLKKFPLEANIVPHFSVIDAEEQSTLLNKSFKYALENCDVKTIEILSMYLSVDDIKDTLQKLKLEKSDLGPLFEFNNNEDEFIENLRRHLKIGNHKNIESILQDFFDFQPSFSELYKIYDYLSDKDKNISDTLKSYKNNFEKYKNIFLTLKNTIRKKIISHKDESLQKILTDEADRVLETVEKINHLEIINATNSLFKFYSYFSKKYEALKKEQNVLDYDDLIIKTKNLLENAELQPWVLYKLDGGIDHILVDEAQDTNQTQWDIIKSITKEFFAGVSAKETHRTIFVVGDTKQSIYSFQGANPEIFKDVRALFSDITKSVQHPWKEIDLNVSFRSTPAILQSVDAVFHENFKLHKDNNSYAKHISHRHDQAGKVEVWPLTQPEENEDIEPWTLPKEQKFHKSTRRKLAEEIAQAIQDWIKNKKVLPSKGRPIDPSDIMILVRRRDQFVEEIVRALKRYNIDVTGVDRLILTDQLPIMDLIVFAEFLLLPDDSLRLATVLKSPLINMGEQDLFDLCQARENNSLWQTLKNRKDKNPTFLQAYETINFFLNKIDFLTPYEFFMEILSTQKFKHNFLARLGTEIEDALNEFLNICLNYEQNHIPSLQKFVGWIQSNPPEIKRNLEQSIQGKVRIMTVHGSKGLQAPIVFLPDTTNVPLNRSNFLWDNDHKLFVWCPKSDLMTEQLKTYKTSSRELVEYNRLLYVAMTRAEDQLYICGWQPQRAIDTESWYSKISTAIHPISKRDSGKLTLENPQIHDVNFNELAIESDTIHLPEWFEKMPEGEKITSIINPSKMEEDKNKTVKNFSPSSGILSAADKGTLIHKILQWILKSPVGQREIIIKNYLENFGLPDKDVFDIQTIVLKTLNSKDLQPFIQGNYICEMPVAAVLENGNMKGIIDLVHFDFDKKVISILDYKTGTFHKDYLETPSEAYKKQLEIYKDTLQKVYGDFTINTYLVWTDGNHIIKFS